MSEPSPHVPALTGDAAVDAALARLGELDPQAPPEDQLPLLAEVLGALRGRLGAVEA